MASQEFQESRPAIEQSTDRVQTSLEQYRLPVASEISKTPLPVDGSTDDVRDLGLPNLAVEDEQIAQARMFNRRIQPARTAAGLEWDSPHGDSRTVIKPDGSSIISDAPPMASR